MKKLEFNPTNGFRDKSSFPDPQNETETREQMQRIPDQIKDYINNNLVNVLVDKITSNDGSIQVSKDGTTYDLKVVVTSTGVTKKYVDERDLSSIETAIFNANQHTNAWVEKTLVDAKTYTDDKIKKGQEEPSNSLGVDGDIYLKY